MTKSHARVLCAYWSRTNCKTRCARCSHRLECVRVLVCLCVWKTELSACSSLLSRADRCANSLSDNPLPPHPLTSLNTHHLAVPVVEKGAQRRPTPRRYEAVGERQGGTTVRPKAGVRIKPLAPRKGWKEGKGYRASQPPRQTKAVRYTCRELKAFPTPRSRYQQKGWGNSRRKILTQDGPLSQDLHPTTPHTLLRLRQLLTHSGGLHGRSVSGLGWKWREWIAPPSPGEKRCQGFMRTVNSS